MNPLHVKLHVWDKEVGRKVLGTKVWSRPQPKQWVGRIEAENLGEKMLLRPGPDLILSAELIQLRRCMAEKVY